MTGPLNASSYDIVNVEDLAKKNVTPVE